MQTGASDLSGAGTRAGISGAGGRLSDARSPQLVGAAGAPALAGARAVATAGMPAPSTTVGGGVAGKAAVGGSSALPGAAAGSGAAGKGAAGMTAAAGAGSSGAGKGETGRMVGITDAHNAVRARIMDPKPEPALPPLKWSEEIAKIAQAYADKLASGGNCLNLVHSQRDGYGENLAGYGGKMASVTDVVEGWAGEEECYTFGPLMSGDACDMACTTRQNSNGCGHYTQVVWRGTTEVGCGMATCGTGRSAGEVWVCNYKAPGNYIGMKPY